MQKAVNGRLERYAMRYVEKTIATLLLVAMASGALAQVEPPPPPPPPPPPVVSTPAEPVYTPSAGNSALGAVVVGGLVWYIMRGMTGVYTIARAEGRQASGCEFLTWPLPVCGPLSVQDRLYLELALQYGNLPSVKEKILFARANGALPSWPATVQAMRSAIAFERANFAINH